MSQAENKVNWCLAKAEKELEERQKHRGLVKQPSNNELASQHIAKAEHNFKALQFFKRNGFEDWSVSAGFYCVYHCFLALLAKHGYESRNQECTIAAIEYLIEQKKIPLDLRFVRALKQYEKVDARHETTAIELREVFQYGTGIEVESAELQWLTQLCKEAMDAVKEILPPKF